MKLKLLKKDLLRNRPYYLILLPIVAYFIVFNYIPMVGILMAFEKFDPVNGFFGSKWIGFKNFTDFFNSYYFFRILKNTIVISVLGLIIGFPMPILLALLINEAKSKVFKKVVQTSTYLPYFVSTVVVAGLVINFVAEKGIVNDLIQWAGGERSNLLTQSEYFRTILISSDLWQSLGYSTILYIAALSGIDQELYEAATIDGANRLQRVWHVTMPGISSTIIIMLILRCGHLLSVNGEKILLLYSPKIYETADVISTFVYRKGLQEFNYGYSTAVGLFNSLVGFALIILSNKIARKYSETSLF